MNRPLNHPPSAGPRTVRGGPRHGRHVRHPSNRRGRGAVLRRRRRRGRPGYRRARHSRHHRRRPGLRRPALAAQRPLHQRLPGQLPGQLGPGSASQGNQDLVNHLRTAASNCAAQRFILVGYSQGANVVDNSIGISSDGALVGGPIVATIPTSIAPPVAAVLLFGNPIRAIGRTVTGTYQARTLDTCASGDPVCGGGANVLAHLSYSADAAQAAAFAAARV